MKTVIIMYVQSPESTRVVLINEHAQPDSSDDSDDDFDDEDDYGYE